jgi:hypothetical protein
MRIARPALAVAALAALSVGATTAFATTASATPNTTPQKVCGSAYKTVNSAAVGSLGTVYLTYNASNGQNCVTTIRNNPGTAVEVATYLYIPDTDQSTSDDGFYTSYAGPVYAYGKGHCVSWGGSIANVSVSIENSNCASLKEHRVTTVR